MILEEALRELLKRRVRDLYTSLESVALNALYHLTKNDFRRGVKGIIETPCT